MIVLSTTAVGSMIYIYTNSILCTGIMNITRVLTNI